MGGHGLVDLAQEGQLAGTCKHSNYPSGSIQ